MEFFIDRRELNRILEYSINILKQRNCSSLEEEIDKLKNNFKSFPPINPIEKHINLSKKKVKLILERRFYKNLYNFIKKDSMEIEDKILKLLFQGIENKYSPEKCLFSL